MRNPELCSTSLDGNVLGAFGSSRRKRCMWPTKSSPGCDKIPVAAAPVFQSFVIVGGPPYSPGAVPVDHSSGFFFGRITRVSSGDGCGVREKSASPPDAGLAADLPAIRQVTQITIITGLNILQNNAVPQNRRALANGISVTAMSIFKAIAPAAGGALLSWAEKRKASFLPGVHMVFFVLNACCLLGLLLLFKPFLALPRRAT